MMNRNPSSIPQMQNPHKLVTAAQTMSFAPQLTRTTLGVPGLTPAMPPAPFPSFRPGIPVPPDFRGWYPSGQHSGSFPISGTPLLPVPVGMMSASPGIRYPPTSFQVLLPSPGIPVTKMPTPRIQNRNSEEYVGPTTTVFVGNISERASDLLIRQMLTKCGNVVSWKRVQGASGKLQAFGFCEYREPGSSLRAIRLLHDFQLGDRKLLVKVDAKTKAQLDEWKAKRKNTSEPDKKEEEGKEKSDNEEELDDDSQKQDALVKASLDALVREYASELNALPSDLQPKRRRREKKEEDINNMEIEDEKKDLISREISKFRDTHMRSVGVT